MAESYSIVELSREISTNSVELVKKTDESFIQEF